MNDLKIGTHDSATGEKGKGLLSWLLTPFAKTQNKTIREQYQAGCTLFDIRVKKLSGEWYCAHGPWHTKRTATDILAELDQLSYYYRTGKVNVTITYEGGYENNEELLAKVSVWKLAFQNIAFGPVSVKYGKTANGVKVKYDTLVKCDSDFTGSGVQGFIPLDGRDWRTYLPIPWLWNKIYTPHHEFGEEIYTYVDFL